MKNTLLTDIELKLLQFKYFDVITIFFLLLFMVTLVPLLIVLSHGFKLIPCILLVSQAVIAAFLVNFKSDKTYEAAAERNARELEAARHDIPKHSLYAQFASRTLGFGQLQSEKGLLTITASEFVFRPTDANRPTVKFATSDIANVDLSQFTAQRMRGYRHAYVFTDFVVSTKQGDMYSFRLLELGNTDLRAAITKLQTL